MHNDLIIDFHTHPFIDAADNICQHSASCAMSPKNTAEVLQGLGVSVICGSVISCDKSGDPWQRVLRHNETALELKKLYGDFYVPGFHVHPGYVKQSCGEIERMASLGVHLIGELVPYLDSWEQDYADARFDEILDVAEQYGDIISFHSMNEDAMDAMVKKHPDTVFVAAHPGEYGEFERHMKRMAMSENYYIDLSGYGIFRYGMLRHAIDIFGAERFLYGSDFPTCSPAMFLNGVLRDALLTEHEKEQILGKNAAGLLGLIVPKC